MNRDQLKGVIVIMPTALNSDGSIDEENYKKNIQKICKSDVKGIMILGTTGEFYNLSFEEYKLLVDIIIKEASNNIKVIVGASGINTAEAIKRTKYAEIKGADAAINVIPFYQTLNQNEIIKYFRELSAECREIGIIAYNNHITAKVNIAPQTYKELSKIKNFIGSKEITSDYFYYMNILHAAPNLKLMPVETLVVPASILGCDGFFSSIIFMNPIFQNELYEACKEKNWEKAINIQYKIVDFINNIVVPLREKYSEVSLAKALVNASGFLKVGPPRSPYIPVSQSDQIKIREDLDKLHPYLIYK
jgi:4-hydroxy-tetrahydrodipicolinate synthase